MCTPLHTVYAVLLFLPAVSIVPCLLLLYPIYTYRLCISHTYKEETHIHIPAEMQTIKDTFSDRNGLILTHGMTNLMFDTCI